MKYRAVFLGILFSIQGNSQVNYIQFPQSCDFIHLTPNGLLLLSSTEGLYYHNGEELKEIQLLGLGETNIQSGFYPDNKNNLWFCTYSRIIKLNLLDFSYKSFPLVNTAGDTMNGDYYLFHLNDSLLMGKSGNDIYSFNILTGESKQLNGSVNGRRLISVPGSTGATYLSYYYTYSPSIVQFSDRGTVKQIKPWQGWPSKALATDIVVLDSIIVLISSTKGLYVGNMRSGTVRPVSSVLLDGKNIRSMNRYSTDQLLISILDEANYLIDLNTISHEPQLRKLSLEGVPSLIDRMLLQSDGTLFLSCYDTAIFYLHPDRIKFSNLYYDNPDGDVFFKSFFADWENRSFQNSSTLSDRMISVANAALEFQSNRPFTSSLLRTKSGTNRFYEHPTDTTLYGYFKSDDNNIYAGFINGDIFWFTETGPEKVPAPDFHLKGINFYYNQGPGFNLAGVNNEKLVFWDQQDPEKTKREFSFTGNIHNAISVKDKNVIILSSTGGIGVLSQKNRSLRMFNTDQSCYCSLADDDGAIWYSTSNEIVKFEIDSQKTTLYNASSGASKYKYQKGKCKRISADSLIFFHDKGATIVRPNHQPVLSRNSQVHIGEFKVNDITYRYPDYLNYNNQFNAPYSDNTLSFVLNNIDWSDIKAASLKYMLEDFDDNWIYLTRRNQTIRYPKIPPGEYLLKVVGQNSDGIWNSEAKVIKINIKAPYWQTWWFRLLAALALIGIVYSGSRYYYRRKLERKNQLLREQALIIEKQQAVENERTRIASEMHDDLGSGLTTIRYLSDKALKQAKDAEEAGQIRRIAEHSNTLVRNMSEIIWAMNSRFDNTENLTGYLRRYASEYLDERQMPFHFEANESNESHTIGGEKRRNIFLVFKELLHNTVKYSQAKSVLIRIDSDADFVITISELGGKGFDPEESVEKGNGLFNCRKRLSSIDGELSFEKTDDAMNIIISVPVKSSSLA